MTLTLMTVTRVASMHWRRLIAGALGLAITVGNAMADDAITILYHVRPPYAELGKPAGVKGLLVGPVIRALNNAELSAQWIEMPPVRQTEEIKRTPAAICGLGWFKRPEREEFAIFVGPIYRDRPSVVVARRDDPRFAAPVSLQRAFADPGAKLIVKTGYSYGAIIDAWMQQLHPNTEDSNGSNEAILNMIAMNRRDYAIMAAEEADYLLQNDVALGAALQAVELSDAPKGEERFLMCSKSTPADTIAKLNAELADPANW